MMADAGVMEMVDLEAWLDDALRCESRHRDADQRPYGPCTVEVVARWGATCAGGRSILVCSTVKEYAKKIMALPNRKCGPCQRPTHVCWFLHPV
jgi:hypothetical protein